MEEPRLTLSQLKSEVQKSREKSCIKNDGKKTNNEWLH